MKTHTHAKTSHSLEDRLADVEVALKKQTRLTALAAVIAAILGSSGVGGILAITSQRPLQQAEVRLKQAEAASRELDDTCKRHAQSIDALQHILDSLSKQGDTNKAVAVRKIMIQQEADFQRFFTDFGNAMSGLWNADRQLTQPGQQCQRILNEARAASLSRQQQLAALVQ
jgi:hypothetical protein